MINAVLPMWRKKYELTQPIDKIRKNFEYLVDEAYISLMSGDNNKDYYGLFVDNEFFIRRRITYIRGGGLTLKCKISNVNEISYADVTIGYRYWEYLYLVFFASIVFFASKDANVAIFLLLLIIPIAIISYFIDLPALRNVVENDILEVE